MKKRIFMLLAIVMVVGLVPSFTLTALASNAADTAAASCTHPNLSPWQLGDHAEHYRYCTLCGEYAEYATHTGGEATCTEPPVCEECGAEYDSSLGGHAWGEWTTNGDGTHTRMCQNDATHTETEDCSGGDDSCTPICEVCNSEYSKHTGGTATCAKQAVCEVCNQPYGDYSTTNHGEFSDWRAYYETQHVRYCTLCGEEEYADHTGGTATCMERAVCKDCDKTYGELSTTNHGEFSDWIAYDVTRHFRWCTDCGQNWEYGTHTGGEATCAVGAICTDCNEIYSDPASEHTGPYSDWEYWSNSVHLRTCLTCNNPETGNHTGGTATCGSKPVCEVCESEYGSSLDHDWGEWTTNDDNTHTRVCKDDVTHTETGYCSGGDGSCTPTCAVCGSEYYNANGNHTGGTATCAKQAVCEVCNQPYGDYSTTNHGEFTDWNQHNDGIQHYRYCTDCGHYQYADHTGGTATCNQLAVCEECGVWYGDVSTTNHGEFSDWYWYDDTQHYRYCTRCFRNREYADHTGGTANCVSGPVCTICEGEYGNKDSEAHVVQMSEWRTTGAAEHIRTCSACGYSEYESHSPGSEATCVTGTICAVCNYEYGSRDYNNHTGLPTYWEYDIECHWKHCQTCRAPVIGFHTGGTPTCTEHGVCEVCNVPYIPATYHNWGKGVSNDDGTHTRVCLNDASHKVTNVHTGGKATCTEDGVCKICDAAYIPAINHNWGAWESNDDGTHTRVCQNDATHTETENCSGGEATYTEDGVCEVCGAAYLPAIKHDDDKGDFIYIPITYPPVVDGGDNGDVVVTPKNPKKGDTVVITPDLDAGYEVDEIIVTDKKGNLVTVIDNGDGTYSFKQPSGKVTIKVTCKEIITVCPRDQTCPLYGYTDLDRTAWYHDGVHFCIEHGLMQGIGNNQFNPNGTTTRAMIVTILWRLEEEPVVNYLMQFEDVPQDEWYSEAVRWAAANGIVLGYDDGLFYPEKAITREQLAAILHRYAAYKGVDNGVIFPMIPQCDYSLWAENDVIWADMNGLLDGIGNDMTDMTADASRAEVAAMLRRFCEISG